MLGAYPARQADRARLRWWEVAGTAHADKFQVGPQADGLGCPAPVNDGPGRFVPALPCTISPAGSTGTAPPQAPRSAIDAATKTYVRDQYGNVKGGIRTPLVDTPVDTLSGESAGGSIVCILFGSTKPLTAEQLAARATGRAADYRRQYRAAAAAGGRVGLRARRRPARPHDDGPARAHPRLTWRRTRRGPAPSEGCGARTQAQVQRCSAADVDVTLGRVGVAVAHELPAVDRPVLRWVLEQGSAPPPVRSPRFGPRPRPGSGTSMPRPRLRPCCAR